MKKSLILKNNNHFKEFEINGFFIIRNFFDKQLLKNCLDEIYLIKKADKYYEKNGKLRRIERIYDKGKNLKKINNSLIKFLNKTFNKKFVIFKDKLNAKPPGGKGFFAHYDGIFYFKNKNNILKRGWYEYSDFFINSLIAFDKCTEKNGTIEISKNNYKDSFFNLIKNTYKDGTPRILKKIEKKINFQKIILGKGDVLFFSNTCPHRSKQNKTKRSRKTLYYTYATQKNNNIYNRYFLDKLQSQNKTSKSL